MLHPFIPSQLDNTKCASCKYTALDHTSGATCESCGNSGTCEISGPFNHPQSMLLCMDCIDAEKKAVHDNQSVEKQNERADRHNELIKQSRMNDKSVNQKTDLFNAQTVANVELKNAIDNDTSIQNKQFAYCAELKARIEHFSSVIFDARKTLGEATEKQKALQVEFSVQANKLRTEERARLGAIDISYSPSKPKTVKPIVKKASEKKWTKQEVREMAAKYSVPVDAVQLICVARNMDAESAAKMLHGQLHGQVN